MDEMAATPAVVYRTIPTSNHNCKTAHISIVRLYIVLFLHQTTTIRSFIVSNISCISYYSYIKPQLMAMSVMTTACCISYYSYIKPQPVVYVLQTCLVVYRTIPTSNHNLPTTVSWRTQVVYRTIPTSNHNR